jgi:hypothetical protein
MSDDFVLSEQDSFVLTREDRENMVIALYRQGKTRREIAKISRTSFTDIKKIIDGEFGPEEEKKNGKNSELSPFSRALKLFLSGAKPVTVSIKLSLSYEEVRKIYLQFLKLNRMYRLRQIYDELGDDIKPFISFYDKMQENNFTTEQITEAVKFVDSLPQLQERYNTLNTQTTTLESKRRKHAVSVTMLKNQIDEAKRELDYYRYECETKKNELVQMNQEIITMKNFIQNFDNEEGYIRIKEAAKQQIELLLQNNRQTLTHAISATFEAIRRYPAIQDLFFQLLTVGSYPGYQQSWMELHESRLIELGEYIQMEMKQQITNDVMSNIQNTNSGLLSE